ncbi:MAG: hypothetical protein U9R42_03340 [Bacteroidota bacterium]|nr:hypothetical protein [Bacteroidota bacterium]
MYSSRKAKDNIILSIFNDSRTVFRLNDIALLVDESNFNSLNKKLNYAVRTDKLQNPRKGIYTKPNYEQEELACSIFTPSYISLEYVLQKAGVIFQYDSRITIVSYLSRNINVQNRLYVFRKIKNNVLVNTMGILRQNNHVNIASAERAFLDLLYLEKEYYFDNLNPLKKEVVYKLLPLYQSETLNSRVTKII